MESLVLVELGGIALAVALLLLNIFVVTDASSKWRNWAVAYLALACSGAVNASEQGWTVLRLFFVAAMLIFALGSFCILRRVNRRPGS